MSSIIDQANSRVQTGESRFQSRGNIETLSQQAQEANFAAQASKNKQKVYQAVSEYNQSGAEQEKAQGQQLINSGNAKMGVGGGLMAMGGVMVAVGMGMMFAGGAGAGMIAKGMGMMGQGLGQIIMGSVDVGNGRAALARYQEKLDKAVANEVLSSQEGKIIRKEMNRSKILEFKKEALENLVDVMRPMLEKMGLNGDELNEDQLSKWFEKMFEDGAETLANGGILETNLDDTEGNALFTDDSGESLEGTFYFMKDDETGEFFQIEPATDEDGNILTGALGEPLLDTEQGVNKVEEGSDLETYLKLQYQFVDLAGQLAGQLGTSEFNDYGEQSYTAYDVNNLDHMREFSDLVSKTNMTAIESGQLDGPLKLIEEDGELFFQQWDWVNDLPVGIKIPADELTGNSEDFDRGDIDSYQAAIDRSQAALDELGIGVGSEKFNLLAAQDNFQYTPRSTFGESDTSFGDLSGRSSDAFRNFSSVSNTLDSVRSPNLLEDSQSDLTRDGGA